MYYAKMLSEKQRLTEQIASLQNQIAAYPDGSIYCTRNGKHYKWYYTDEKNHHYIPKKDRELAEQLTVKKYLSACLADALHQKTAVDFYLRHYPRQPGKAETLLTECPEYQKLLSPYFTPLSQELLEWEQSDYEKNPYKPEHLTIQSGSGNYVRSKSEALIDMVLYMNRIPFRYECALHLGDAVIFPDFTIRHPETGKTFYWEHFGLMDNPGYRQKTGEKLQFYISHGIIPNLHLITTYETKDTPLSVTALDHIIHEYFL